ncbi:autoinducer binding domain-containing protein [Cognatishimia sp. MH4019]|uniref:helix-turn-helix transcriptional regulator n=1 Tax=Cognatishimia sp. MH4019 TaxID=2854030 RepID=UPI001CD325D1|nr:autoinducer binding domain-containing protein [Cognatishimia sp. MH4019]
MKNLIDLEELKTLAPAGYHIAVRMGFVFPAEEHNAMPLGWVRHYTARGFMMQDPILRWAYAETGQTRWSALKENDPFGILDQARGFGLTFGVAVSLRDLPGDAATGVEQGSRSFGSFARHDREFAPSEIARLQDIVQERHDALTPPTNLTEAELEAMRLARDGMLLKEIAHQLGVSEGAIKQRLKSAKLKLDARNSTHAIAKATQFGLI